MDLKPLHFYSFIEGDVSSKPIYEKRESKLQLLKMQPTICSCNSKINIFPICRFISFYANMKSFRQLDIY